MSVKGVRKRQSFSTQICPPPITQIKMHARKELPLCMGDGEKRDGEVRLCVCVSLTSPPFKQRGEYVCNVCIFSVLQKKKKKEN